MKDIVDMMEDQKGFVGHSFAEGGYCEFCGVHYDETDAMSRCGGDAHIRRSRIDNKSGGSIWPFE